MPAHPLSLGPMTILSVLALSASAACAQDAALMATLHAPSSGSLLAEALFSSSGPASASKDPAPNPASFAAANPAAVPGAVAVVRAPRAAAAQGVRPFSSMALTVKAGTTGVGFDLSSPLARHFALRTGASFFSYNTSLTEDGMHITGSLHLQSAAAGVDIYPFHNSFRISPGLSFSNQNYLGATLLVPGGQSFSFGDGGTYYSDPLNPVRGSAAFVLGKRFAPRITTGWGNVMPHAGGRVSFPVEIGFQYIAAPAVALNITGNSCGTRTEADGTTEAGCGAVDQTNVQQEQTQLQNDLSPLRFLPVASLGVSVRIGNGRRSE